MVDLLYSTIRSRAPQFDDEEKNAHWDAQRLSNPALQSPQPLIRDNDSENKRILNFATFDRVTAKTRRGDDRWQILKTLRPVVTVNRINRSGSDS